MRGWFARRWASNQARCRNHDDSRHFVLVTLPLMTDSFILGRIRVAGIGVDWRKGKYCTLMVHPVNLLHIPCRRSARPQAQRSSGYLHRTNRMNH